MSVFVFLVPRLRAPPLHHIPYRRASAVEPFHRLGLPPWAFCEGESLCAGILSQHMLRGASLVATQLMRASSYTMMGSRAPPFSTSGWSHWYIYTSARRSNCRWGLSLRSPALHQSRRTPLLFVMAAEGCASAHAL